jgi:hypothetical protein
VTALTEILPPIRAIDGVAVRTSSGQSSKASWIFTELSGISTGVLASGVCG